MERVLDQFNRPLRDLRISVTDQCNFRCAYCMPKEIFGPDYAFLPKSQVLSNDEIVRLANSFEKLGVQKIRLTGGEPLLRRDLIPLIALLRSKTGIDDISLTTNASLLPRYAAKLKEAGLSRINISMDSLKDETLSKMNGKNITADTIVRGIDAACESEIPTKVNMVVKRGSNDDEVLSMATLMKERGVTLRFIEFMDVGNTNQWKLEEVVSAQSILNTIRSRFEIEPLEPNYRGEVAARYRFKDDGNEFGIVNSVTNPFCSDCNRARISADGKLYTCLFANSGYDLRAKLRNGANDQEVTSTISRIWGNRHDRYSEERSNPKLVANSGPKVEMSYIGG